MDQPFGIALTVEPFTAALISAVVLLLIVRTLDVWEREPLWVLGLMALWGATGAAVLSVIGNEAVMATLSKEVNLVFGAAISAPVVEEISKGLALLAALLLARWAAGRTRALEFDGVTDGMVFGAAIGLGFAFTENNLYFLNFTGQENIKVGAQVLEMREGFLNLGTLGHAIYTGCFGAGLGYATWARSTAARIGAPLLGLAVAMFLHAFNNGFAQLMLVSQYGFDATVTALSGGSLPQELAQQMTATFKSAVNVLDIVGYALIVPFLVGMLLWVRHERKVLRYELAEETNTGLITREEWEIVPHYFRRLRWYAQLLFSGRLDQLRTVRHVHHELGELAFEKWRLRRTGATDASAVERRRQEIRWLRERHQMQAAASPGTPG